MATLVQAAPQDDQFRPVAPVWHTALVFALITAQAVRGWLQVDHIRAQANPNRTAMYGRTMLMEWLLLGLVLLGVRLGGSSLYTVLGERWRSVSQFLRDAGIGVLFLVAAIVVTSVLATLTRTNDSSTLFLLPQSAGEKMLWIALSLTAGVCEEAVYRGYLQRQLLALTRNVAAGILLPALLFGAAHSYQGFAKAAGIAVLGAMGGVLAFWRRSVRPGMIAHFLQDALGGFIRH